ncbi:germinal center-associated signaling and motility protein [Dasypus novemcinctus]|uniref:germinal center-associated signaling and motility protein n=1 Tax=Dasypus novemcinctus TaxID=9361 RepID=UPI00265FFAEB|nr:germinal center-associated signaling and motility protein [Dasypus novemcinctus]
MGNYLLRECRKKMRIFKARQHFQKESKRMPPAPSQEKAELTFSEEVCYTLINHRVLERRPSADGYYENVAPNAERPRESLGKTETEYSLLHVPSTPRPPPPPEDEYEFIMPSRISYHSLQQSCPFMPPSETQFSHL